MEISEARSVAMDHGWLSLTHPAFRMAVLERSALQAFSAGETIYCVGDPPGGLYGLILGSVGVSIAPGERGPYLAHFARPGTWLGEGPLITGGPRQVGLTATRACHVLHLPLHAFQEIVAEDPTCWRYVALLTSIHLGTAIGAADDLMIRDHVQRFIAILLRLGGCRLASPQNAAAIEFHVSQEDIAVMANVARTTAGAILRRLAKHGHIDLSYSRVRILAPDALRKMLADR